MDTQKNCLEEKAILLRQHYLKSDILEFILVCIFLSVLSWSVFFRLYYPGLYFLVIEYGDLLFSHSVESMIFSLIILERQFLLVSI